MLLNSIDYSVVGNITGGHNDNIITEVIGGVEISQMINTESVGKISVTLDWLSKHMLSV